jgi:hypothetical protein
VPLSVVRRTLLTDWRKKPFYFLVIISLTAGTDKVLEKLVSWSFNSLMRLQAQESFENLPFPQFETTILYPLTV